MESDRGRVRKCDARDDHVHVFLVDDVEQLRVEQRSEALAAAVIAKVDTGLDGLTKGRVRAILAASHNSRVAQSGRAVVDQLIHDDALKVRVVDGVRYLLPPEFRLRGSEQPREVRFVAPFDPIVWDRQRFEHLWGWQYRFEAYMPAAKRRFGYSALPMFWGHEAIGWVNCERTATGSLAVSRNVVDGFARTRVFERAFDVEVSRMESMRGAITMGRSNGR